MFLRATMFGGPRAAWRRGLALLALLPLALLAVGCDGAAPPPGGALPPGGAVPGQAPAPVDAQPPVHLLFPYGSEKQVWLEAATKEFNDSASRLPNGRRIVVEARPMGSGEIAEEILAGRLEAHLASPASAAFIDLANARSKAKTGGPLVGETRNLVLSPVVVAMWKPMAEALGWGTKPIGWSDVVAMAAEPQGWAKHDRPQWGRFKLGHTHPEYSNSGLASVFAEVYAGAGKQRGATVEDVQRPEVGAFVEGIEKSVVHYGSSTGFFGRKMFEEGPEYLSAAVLYENMVVEAYGEGYALPFPIVAVYPKEGTFWSDHPVGVVERPWVGAEHHAAAEVYLAFLLQTRQQQQAMELGFRPADPAVALAAPIDAAHGVDPAQPKTTLETPSSEVMQAMLDLWKKRKKHAELVLAFDVSGSMQGAPLAGAKEGALQFVELLGDEDLLSLLPFNDRVVWAGRDLKMGASRAQATGAVGSYFASGGTACYDAIAAAHAHLQAKQKQSDDRVYAVVVLSDGVDRHSKTSLSKLLSQLQADRESKSIRVFTIGYGAEADGAVLEKIAKATGGKFFRGTHDDVRRVFKEISTFF